eukprot:3002047-Rhodomonas_salina.1
MFYPLCQTPILSPFTKPLLSCAICRTDAATTWLRQADHVPVALAERGAPGQRLSRRSRAP